RNDGRPEPIAGSPEPAWAPVAVAWENLRAKSGLSTALAPWTGVAALSGGERAHTGLAVLDVEGDRDLDLVLSSDGAPPIAILNDRLGQFHEAEVKGLTTKSGSGLLVTDLDADGRPDLVAPGVEGLVLAWRNTTERTTAEATKLTFETWPISPTRWRS